MRSGLPVKRLSVNGVSISQQISRLLIQTARLYKLPCSPGRCRMFCDVEMQNPPPIVAQNDQHEKDSKGRGWNGEEIKCDDFFAMALEKRPPRLR